MALESNIQVPEAKVAALFDQIRVGAKQTTGGVARLALEAEFK